MSCDIRLYIKTGIINPVTQEEITEEVMSMNWLRNPYGLIRWIYDNTGVDLYHVINDPSYDKSDSVDRDEFLRLATLANAEVQRLDRGYFIFDLKVAQQFGVTSDDCDVIIDNKLYVKMRAPHGDPEKYYTLERYKKWTKELYDFAVLLQDPKISYYCDN